MDYKNKEMLLKSEDKSNLSLSKRCNFLGFNRSSYYITKKEKYINKELISDIEKIYEDKPFYGYRRVLVNLNELGHKVGKKKVIKLRKELNLKTIYPRTCTTIINKEHSKYKYLLSGIEINKPNKVWSIDITYLNLNGTKVYFSGIIDWYSRKILSYRISNTLDTNFCIETLEEAISKYGKPEIFNSDQGSQFTSEKFTSKLLSHGIKISMDGKGRWADNILIERFFRTFKYENIFLKKYETMRDLKEGVSEYIIFYNSQRYHSSLFYQTPDQVYFKRNHLEVSNFYKIDKDLILKLFIYQNLLFKSNNYFNKLDIA